MGHLAWVYQVAKLLLGQGTCTEEGLSRQEQQLHPSFFSDLRWGLRVKHAVSSNKNNIMA
jgi:hypothetical protein